MEEKKSTSSFLMKILILLIFGMGILALLNIIHTLRDKTFFARIESWILVGTRGYYGNPEAINRLSGFPLYSLELLGDTHYRRGDTDAAIDAYGQALKIEANTMIELKRNLLIAQTSASGSTTKTITGSTDSVIDETLSRIEKDASNREKYFGKGENYSNISPIFETRDKEVIDW